MPAERVDAVVVGAGPNGLSAAIELARAGLSVVVIERGQTIGGGARTAELTLPGFRHDICSAIHPMGLLSPYFQTLPLAEHGLEWIDPPLALAHPFDDGSCTTLERDIEASARTMSPDEGPWGRLVRPYVEQQRVFFREILKPIRLPAHPLLMARFGLSGLQSCERIARSHFRGPKARALFAGCAAHSMLPLDRLATASFGIVLAASAHAVGWPCARGGSQSIVDALASYLAQLGGSIRTGEEVRSLAQLPQSRVVLFDLTPRQIAAIAGDSLPARYRERLLRYRYGPGVFKIDFALRGPIPWRAAECLRAGTVHLGSTLEEIAVGEDYVWKGRHSGSPFVLVAQQSLFDPTRAPAGKQTAWAYCHVPHGSSADMTEAIEGQIERFAPGFREQILGRHTMTAMQLEGHNPNMIGGDIGGGANDLRQFLTRPFARWNPYTTPNERLFLCSSSTPPGGGVHGMSGYWAASAALKRAFGRDAPTRLESDPPQPRTS
jgi:phytoene dehydrogenase-like protein